MVFSLAPEKTGTYALRERLTSAQMNKIKACIEAALDIVGGGSYTLHGDDLTIATDAAKRLILDLNAQLSSGKTLTIDDAIILIQGVSGRLNLTAGSGINIFHGAVLNLDGASGGAQISAELGSLIDLSGLLKVESGGEISVESGGVAQVKSGGAFNLLAGALMDVLGGITFESGSLVDLLSGAILNLDHGASLVLHNVDQLGVSDVGSTNVGAWFSKMIALPFSDISSAWFLVSTGGGTHGYEQADVASQRKLLFPVPLLPGDGLTSITARITVSTQPGFSITKPKITLFRIDSNGDRTDVASRTDPSASQGAYETIHDITLDASNIDSGAMPQTLSTQPMFLEFKGQTGSDALTNSLVLVSIRGASIQRAFRVPIENG